MTLAGPADAGNYDPLAVDPSFTPSHLDLTAHDATRHRDLPVRIYLPAAKTPAPVVLFSHGMGGDREGSPFLGKHWAARGYVAVFLQHPGSDDKLWRGKPMAERMRNMEAAANLHNLLLRFDDVPAVLDQLAEWNSDASTLLAGRMDLQHIGMSGHSFGAVTTEGVSGQSVPLEGQKFTDTRIKAAIMFSPSTPHTSTADEAFAEVNIPWMLMTGTKDIAPIGNTDMASRLAVYPALRRAPKYELVLFNAEHSVFTDRVLPGDKEPRNPNHHRVIIALSTAFWDAYLRNDAAAKAWLNSPAARSVMETQDKYQFAMP